MEANNSEIQFFILSALGPDRTGIVQSVSKFLYERNCNIVESRMAVLGGEFAIILLASGEKFAVETVEKEVADFEKEVQLTINFRLTSGEEKTSKDKFKPYQVNANSLDHPGIVFQVSHLMHQMNVNILDVDTEQYLAPFGGAPMFNMEMIIQVPANLPIGELKAKLLQLSDKENIDIEVCPYTG